MPEKYAEFDNTEFYRPVHVDATLEEGTLKGIVDPLFLAGATKSCWEKFDVATTADELNNQLDRINTMFQIAKLLQTKARHDVTAGQLVVVTIMLDRATPKYELKVTQIVPATGDGKIQNYQYVLNLTVDKPAA
jgi:hypothetical protein